MVLISEGSEIHGKWADQNNACVLRGHPAVQKHCRAPRTILAIKVCYVFHSQQGGLLDTTGISHSDPWMSP